MTYSIQIRYSSHIVKILNITAYAIDYNYRNTLVRPSYTVPWDIVKAMALTITFSDYMPPFVGGVEKEVFFGNARISGKTNADQQGNHSRGDS